MLWYWLRNIFAPLIMLFQPSCVVCKVPDRKAGKQAIRMRNGWAFHQDCLDKVLANPEGYSYAIISKCTSILSAKADLSDQRTMAIFEMLLHKDSLKFREAFNAKMLAIKGKELIEKVNKQ